MRTPKNPVIIVTGMHGVGKSTQAVMLAEEFKLKYVSTGLIFRSIAEKKGVTLAQLSEMSKISPDFDKEVDSVTLSILDSGGVVLDSLLAAWFAKDVESFKILLKASFEVRCSRIALRENRPLEEVVSETLLRESSERERFLKYYGFDIEDSSIYDMVLDTSDLSKKAVSRILKSAVSAYLEEKWGVDRCLRQ